MELPTPPDPEPGHPAHFSGRRFNPWFFFTVLLLPGIASILTLTQNNRNYGEAALNVLLIGSVIAGLFCGIHFTLIQTRLSRGAKIALGVVSVIGCAGAAFALGIGSCMGLAALGVTK